MTIFDFLGIGNKKEASAPIQGVNALFDKKKSNNIVENKEKIAVVPTSAETGEGSIISTEQTPKIDFFTPKNKVANVPQIGQPKIPETTIQEHIPTNIEKIKDAVVQFGSSFKGGLMQNVFESGKGLTGPIGEKIVEGSESPLSDIAQKGNIGVKDILKYMVTPQSFTDVMKFIPEKYKKVAQEWLGKENIKIGEKETKFYENNPDLLPKYTTGLVTAIKNKDTKQLSDPSYRADLVGRGAGQMLPALTIAIATKNPELALISFFPQQVQEAYDDVKNDPNIQLNDSQKQSYALALGGITTAIENMSFGIVAKPFLKSVEKEVMNQVLKSPLKAGLMQVLESFGAEGTEEVLQKLTTDTMAKIFGSTRNFPKIEELASTFLEAGIGSLGAGGFGGITEFASQKGINKEIMAKPVEKGERFQDIPPDVVDGIKKEKGLSAQDIMSKYPDIQLKKDIPVTDIHGNKSTIDAGEALTPYEIKGNKILLQDGQTYIVSKNQYQNIKNQSIIGEAKDFAPELKETEETILGYNLKDLKGRDEAIATRERLFNQYGDISNFTPEARVELEKANDLLQKSAPGEFGGSEERDTKYSKYTLPGGENYKEILIQAPMDIENILKNTSVSKEGEKYVVKYEDGRVLSYANNKQDALDHARFLLENGHEQLFKSSHRSEPNVLAHLRLNERTYNGKKVTFMEELQSDWAREARKNTTREPLKIESNDRFDNFIVMNREGPGMNMFKTKSEAEQFVKQEAKIGIPTHPLLSNRQELTVKRALQDAVENGSEYFAWINGEQTANRYNLSKEIDSISRGDSHTAEKTKGKTIIILPKNGDLIKMTVEEDGKIIRSNQGDWIGKNIVDVIGKGIGEQVISNREGNLKGEGLNIGGERAKNLYDKQVPNIIEKLTGKKPEMIELKTGIPSTEFSSEGKKDITESTKQRSIKLTPDVVARVKGQSPLTKQPSGKQQFIQTEPSLLEQKFQDEEIARDKKIKQSTTEDIAKAQKLLPEATYKTVEQIINPKTGLPAYGSYLDGMITFAKTLAKTTAYHEVFHGYFDMFTDQKTQREILEIVKREQKIKTDLDAEERLAEKFAQHAINVEKGNETEGNYKLLDFLDQLRAKVKEVFGQGDKIKQLYKDIMEGKRPTKPDMNRQLQKKFQEKSKLDEIVEGMDPLEDDYTEKGEEYLDKVEPIMKEIEEITAETTNFNKMTDKELGKFFNSGQYEKLSDFEKQEFDNVMNKRIFQDPLQFADPERQKFIDRIAKLEAKEQRIGKVGNVKISKEKAHQQSLDVDRERESIIEDIQTHYQFESTNDAYDMYAQLRDVPVSQIKYIPRKGEYVSKAERQRRIEERIEKRRNKTPEEKERRIKNIMGNVMTQARERGNQVTEAKAMMNVLDVKKGELPPPLVKENNLSEDFYNKNKLSEKERKEVLKSSVSSDVKEGALNWRARYIKPIGTQLENISKSVYARIKKYDYDVVIKGQQDMKEALPFLEGMVKLKKENIDDYFNLRLALSNRDVVKAKEIMDKNKLEFPKTLLEKIYNEGEEAGFDIGHLEDYFPRVVKDSKGLIGALRKSPEWTYIEDAIRRIEEMREQKLTIEEEGEIINALLLGKSVDGVMIGSPNMKERSIELVKKDLLQYYFPPELALTRYLGSMRDAIEVGKLFGNSGEFDTSLGLFIAQEVADGKIQYEDAEKVRELLEAKFERTKTNPFINWIKTVGYSASLGSYSSTITQLGDLSFSFIENGIAKTLKAYGKSIVGKSELKAGEFGLDDIGQEFRGEGIAKKVLSTILKGSGFAWMDKRGKETYINSTFDELKRLAKKNDVALSRDVAEYYGESKGKQIMKDLKEGKATDDVRTYIFLKLCNIQPLTSTEMPPGYHKNPVFYMLKSFALKQIDYITKKGIKYAIANPKKGIPRLARIMFYIMLMNGLSDELKNITLGRKYNSVFYRLLNGEDVGPALSSLFWDNLFKMFGLTKYSIYEAKTDGIDKAFSNIFLSIPPLQVPGNIISDVIGAINGKTSFEDLKSIQMIPWIGKPMYWRFGKGQASQQKSKEKESNKYAPTNGGL